MTLPAVVRVFFALSVPDVIKERLMKIASDIKKQSKNHAIRFVLPENLHITLQFVGEVVPEHLPALTQVVQEKIIPRNQALAVEFTKLSLLPSPFRPRVVVLEIAKNQQIEDLALAIGEGMKQLGYEVDKRPFRGHMTLGRIKLPQAFDPHILANVVVPELEPILVEEVILFRSESHPNGSHYTPLQRLALTL